MNKKILFDCDDVLKSNIFRNQVFECLDNE